MPSVGFVSILWDKLIFTNCIRRCIRFSACFQIIRPPLHHRFAGFRALPYEYKPCARYCAPDDSSGVLLRPLPINPIPSAHCMPLPGSRDRRYPFRVVTHHPQCLIDRVFTHWLIRVMVAGEDQFIITGDILNLFQNGDGLF